MQADAIGQAGVTTEYCCAVRYDVLDIMLLGIVWSPTACLSIDQCAYLDAFVQECLDHALLEAQDSPAAKHNDSQLAEAEHIGVDCLQHGQHPLQQLHCKITHTVVANPLEIVRCKMASCALPSYAYVCPGARLVRPQSARSENWLQKWYSSPSGSEKLCRLVSDASATPKNQATERSE